MAVESQRIITHSNFLFFVLSLSPNQMRDRLPLNQKLSDNQTFGQNFARSSFVRNVDVQKFFHLKVLNSLIIEKHKET